jgi:ribosomal protein L11 methyltransferase
MKTDPQTILTLELECRRAEPLADWMRARWRWEPILIERPGSSRSWLEIYLPSREQAELAALVLRRRPGVRAADVRTVAPRRWRDAWKHHFPPMAVGRRLYICPAHAGKQTAPPGRRMVLINPGLSFGTGRHFTTRFCLEMLDRVCARRRPRAVLDVGTGSGILALAAARLGARRVLGVDHDPQVIRRARANRRLNRMGRAVVFRQADILADSLAGPYELVLANLNFAVLSDAAPILLRLTAGWLALSGLRDDELDTVADRLVALGAREVVRDGDGEWGGLLFKAAPSGRSARPDHRPMPKKNWS